MSVFEEFGQDHDPDGREDYTFPFLLNAGEALQSAIVEVVDETSTTVDGATDLTVEAVSFGQISGNRWGVTAWISGGGASPQYYLRCRIETNSTPRSRKADLTAVLNCAQT